jgi:hypothetical protein
MKTTFPAPTLTRMWRTTSFFPARVSTTVSLPDSPAEKESVTRCPATVGRFADAKTCTNFAVTASAALMVTSHVVFPVQAPAQPAKTKPLAGAEAMSVARAPWLYTCVHAVPFAEVLVQAPPVALTLPMPETVIVSRSPVWVTVVKVAVTLLAVVIETVHTKFDPAHAPPLQPVKVAPTPGLALRVTLALAAWGLWQLEPPVDVQCRPAPEIDPFPTTCPVSMYVVLPPAKLAPTVLAPFIVSVQVVAVNVEQSPVQPVKSPALPEAGTALRVSEVFPVTLAVHSLPPAAVQ